MGLICPGGEMANGSSDNVPSRVLSPAEYKRKLENAMSLLTDRPDGVADVSSCGLTKLPKDFFQICAVYVKVKVLISDNQITDLESGGKIEDVSRIRILDAHRNRLEKLPVNFGLGFSALLELNLSDNRLKTLPTSFGNLRALQTLFLARNNFSEFPNIICECRQLQELDISENSLSKLPLTFHQLRRLQTFVFDHDKVLYPSKDVTVLGVEAILKKICQDDGKEWLSDVPVLNNLPPATRTRSVDYGMRQQEQAIAEALSKSVSSVTILERYREEEARLQNAVARYKDDDNIKKKEVMKFRAAIEEDDKRHLESIHKVKVREQDMLMRSLQEREKMEVELQKLALNVEMGKQSLLEALRSMEAHSQRLLTQLTSLSEERAKYYKFYEAESKKADNAWRTLLPQMETSKRDMLLLAMKAQLEDSEKFSIMYKRLMDNLRAQNDNVINMYRAEEQLFPSILAKQQAQQENIINHMLMDENVHKEMFRELQLKSDAVYNRIVSDLILLENELATLSLLEQKQTEERSVVVKKSLEDERLQLAKMYKKLMVEKEQREAQLRRIMQDMEKEAAKHAEYFWLAQYGRLMELMPETLNKLPETKKVEIDLDPSTSKGKGEPPKATSPTATALPQTLHLETICSVCMERPSTEIFLPCGHICCCKVCSEPLTECPLCRAEIVQKMTLNKSGNEEIV
ncbi:E3 ubiquitin-protein ligase LRSAM1-like [Paramacrobiotus metropolitanus]|uniref:E3 ubiquitin-protein ligase LRSAM1-like n=1 Tax=Paramacrobiotus metropolitanus TaxID=2943436 RepID=UPI002445D992|nr:E3 ubiquitin-protein ligase LRSAM1-like [Paramacrobiotus metropolitanus]